MSEYTSRSGQVHINVREKPGSPGNHTRTIQLLLIEQICSQRITLDTRSSPGCELGATSFPNILPGNH